MRRLFRRPLSGNSPAIPRRDVGLSQLRLASAVALILVAGTALITPFAGVSLPAVPGFLAVYSTAMIIFSFLAAFLLLIKGSIEQQRDSIRLGRAYLFTSFIMIAQLISYPGAIMPYQLIGGPATPFWLWVFWHAGFAAAILHYAWAVNCPEQPEAVFSRAALSSPLLAACAITMSVYLGQAIPPIFSDGRSFGQEWRWGLVPAALFLGTSAAFLSLLKLKVRSSEQLWLSVGVLAAAIDVWMHWQGVNRFSLGFYAAKLVSILVSLTVLLSQLHQITRLYAASANHNKHLRALVHKDGLTGLSNRRRFDELLVQEFNRSRRNALPLGLILIDVDWFKSYNDTYGHLAGDECLREIARCVSSVLKRAGDEVARYGGEEVVVLLPSTDQRGTLKIAQKMCNAVAALEIEHAGSSFGKVTISAGVSVLDSFDDTMTPADLVGAADKALYQAKSEGRNQAVYAEFSNFARKLCA